MNRFALLLTLLAATTRVAGSPVLRIEHVTVTSPDREQPLRDANVSIQDGRILSVSVEPTVASASAAITVLDGHGLYVIPGLIDSPVHTGAVNGMGPKDEAEHLEIAKAARDSSQLSLFWFHHPDRPRLEPRTDGEMECE
jgi:hypothetical protein